MTRIEAKLSKAGINLKYIIDASANEFEVMIQSDKEGVADYKKTYALAKKCMKISGWEGGYKTGYDSWVVKKELNVPDYDYSNPASRHHY